MKIPDTLISFDFKKILNYAFGMIRKTNANIANVKPPDNDNCMRAKDSELPETITVADIGHHKITVFIAHLNTHKKIEIKGFGEAKTEGVTKGAISNTSKLSKCLKTAIDKATEQVGFIPKSIYVGTSCAIKTHEHQEILIRNNDSFEISINDITGLEALVKQSDLYTKESILYIAPQHYSVDEVSEILNPIGMTGTKLETTFKVITCPAICVKKLKKSCDWLNISLKAVYPSIIASANSVLQEEEIELGVVVVDIGSQKTSIAIYKNSTFFNAETISLGGDNITNDICKYTGLSFKNAEELKIKYAKAIRLNAEAEETIDIKSFKPHLKDVSIKDLAFVVQCRLTEILELIGFMIGTHTNKEQILSGIVFTGGTSKIPLFKQLAKIILHSYCLIYSETKPVFTSINPEIKDQLNNPLYTSALGVLKLAFDKQK